MSQNFNLAAITAFKFNGADCAKVMLNGVRIWERYTATRQVWVSSGYNQTAFQKIGEVSRNQGSWHYRYDHFGVYLQASSGLGTYSYSKNNATRSYKITTHWVGTRRYSRGAWVSSSGSSSRQHKLIIYDNVTSWIDTSSYQTQNYTAYYY